SPSTTPKIPRPANSFMIFRAEKSKMFRKGTHQSEISRSVADMWRNLDPVSKAQYDAKAEREKLAHAAMYPNYRYIP
ncbi:high mobility group box domain-containing protein, partial [Mycena floridula]